jgi:hypothetical protein
LILISVPATAAPTAACIELPGCTTIVALIAVLDTFKLRASISSLDVKGVISLRQLVIIKNDDKKRQT